MCGGVVGLALAIAAVAPAATPGTTGVTGPCSKSVAERAVAKVKWGDPTIGTPVDQVLCGPFFGAGTSGMAVSIEVGRGCAPSVHWGVFQLVGGSWRLVLDRNNGAFLTAVGSDVRETQGVRAPGDSDCSPSAWRARVWHWSGSGFVVGPWKPSLAPDATSSAASQKPSTAVLPTYIASPSGNLLCFLADRGDAAAEVYCQSFQPPRSVRLLLDGSTRTCAGPSCAGNPGEEARPRTLPYGSSVTVGRFRCTSETTGITCAVIASGKRFSISKEAVTRSGGAAATKPGAPAVTTPATTVTTPAAQTAKGLVVKTDFGSCWMRDDHTDDGSWVYCSYKGKGGATAHVKLPFDANDEPSPAITVPTSVPVASLSPGGTRDVGRFRCWYASLGLACELRAAGTGIVLLSGGGLTNFQP
jgi:hypothetical protein